MKKILLINGANMNLLGLREPDKLGSATLEEINREVIDYSKGLGIEVDTYQSNHEGDIIDRIQQASFEYAGVIINPGSFGHYSVGIKEAISTLSIPCIEVHLANFFRNPGNQSTIAPVCTGMISGFGKESYLVAVDTLMKIL
ncbi:3-dehydroquinate dehydratase [Sporosarcina sp. Marseille-Q4063]|uniref:type II 3-dehydroquinate dehydratase n=1 Tax=Sporosarcina sp. Marseille-Q4063 TaxID=2810514 RepID=UPI001BB06FC5|nr:type II 3-dehydroquinate dehydratase [Sporosarcina sp. Marseille-Q4063]QUW21346.1 3-dehydroquinate dehydratase [Sporosarcina sp. Marseille-Q4063]